MAPDLDELRRLAVSVAEEAGALLASGLHRARRSVGTKTSGTDMVTEMDRASEALVARRIREARPGDGMLGEEGTRAEGTTGICWVVDPLDGTTNYLYGLPAYAVSIAAELDGRAVAGAVHDPSHGETYHATLGGGAWQGRSALRRAVGPPLSEALIGTGFSYSAKRRAAQGRVLAGVLPAVRDIRRAGAAALDLCWVAAARLDGYYEAGLQPWDWAAGALIVAESGAWVGGLGGTGGTGTATTPAAGTLVAAAPGLSDQLVELLTASGAGSLH